MIHYIRNWISETKSRDYFVWEIEENDVASDGCDRIASQTNEAKGFETPKEDRTIGVISSKLYWNYFKSGMHSLAIIAIICLFLITQGRHYPIFGITK